MSTRTGHPGVAPYSGRHHWTDEGPIAYTVGIVSLAVVCGALFGLFSALEGGPGRADIHRGGGAHARASAPLTAQTTPIRVEGAAAGATEVSDARAAQPLPGQDSVGGPTIARSPARGGFAAGRSAPATSADQL